MMPLYSICITNFNTENTVKQSLESILSQIDEQFEVVVVDNCSKDSSLSILKEYDGRRIKLIVRKCTRGVGRQIAIDNAKGKYLICHMDMDDIFKPCLKKFLQIYHSNFEGYMLETSDNIMIAPKILVNSLGGYRDLNFVEDNELCSRAAQIGKFRLINFKIKYSQIKIRKEKFARKIGHMFERRYSLIRDCFRVGLGTRVTYENFYVFANIMEHPVSFLIGSGVFIWAFITHWFYTKYNNDFFKTFNPEDYEVPFDND
jgi:glycosyltransferase involved in cell wall biosynthesis